MTQKKFSRRQYWIKGGSQAKLVLRIYLILLVTLLVSGAVFYFLGNRALTEEYFRAHSILKTTMELLLPGLLWVSLLGLLAAFFLVLTFSHSIAGPVHRFKILSEKVAKGDLTVEVKFRKKDSIKELAGAINQVIKGLNGRLSQVEQSLQKLKELSGKVKGLHRLSDEETAHLKEELVALSSELELKMKDFKL